MINTYEVVRDYVEGELNALLWDRLVGVGKFDEYVGYCVDTIINENSTSRDVNILNEAFRWSKTKEGYEFWNNLDKKYPEFRGIYD